VCCAAVNVTGGGVGVCAELSGLLGTRCATTCDANESRLCWGDGAIACSPVGKTCRAARLAIDYRADGKSIKHLATGICL
jgi:hypothetical protein